MPNFNHMLDAEDVGLGAVIAVDPTDIDAEHFYIRVDRVIAWRYTPRARKVVIVTVDGSEWAISDRSPLTTVAMQIDEHLAQVFAARVAGMSAGSEAES